MVAFLTAAALYAAPPDPAAVGRNGLDLLLASQYQEFSQLLTVEAKGLLTAEFLRDHVGSELKSFGTVEEISQPRTGAPGTDTIVSFPVRFSHTAVSVQFTVTQSGQIAGLHFRSPEDPLPQGWKRPSYSTTRSVPGT